MEQKVAKTDQLEQKKPRGHDHLNLIGESAQITTEEECESVVIKAPEST